MKNSKLKPIVLFSGIALAAGALSGLITMAAPDVYKGLEKPPLSPPGAVFPIVWSVLFLLMGISAGLVSASTSPDRRKALTVWAVQLAVNFIWPILFFNMQSYLLAFIWLVVLWVLVVIMISLFRPISPAAAWLQIPYLLWITFAGYLNFFIWLMN